MMELTINGKVYEFNFGMRFLREVNKKATVQVDGVKGAEKNVGLRMAVAGIVDGDMETLVDVLDLANKGREPRVTREVLDNYIDDPDTDIDKLFEDVMDFLKKTNATRKTTVAFLEEVEEQKQNQISKTNTER